jgi:hypothetical protein
MPFTGQSRNSANLHKPQAQQMYLSAQKLMDDLYAHETSLGSAVLSADGWSQSR